MQYVLAYIQCVCVCIYVYIGLYICKEQNKYGAGRGRGPESCGFIVKCDGRNSPYPIILTESGEISEYQGHGQSLLCRQFVILSCVTYE
jgi:hypothetical protein